jgi:hypothetical protein
VGLAGAVLLVFSPVLHHDFTLVDDETYVVANPHLKGGFSAEALAWAWTGYYASNWHPLTWMSHMLDVQLWGEAPGGHHLTSLVLHVVNTVLLFLLLDRLTGALGRSAIVAAVFGVHPLHVESVAWIAERKDVLSALFWFATTWAYWRYARNPRATRYALVFVLLAAGLAAKPMLVTLPLTLLLLDFWPLGRFHSRDTSAVRSAWELLREKIPLVGLSVGSGLVTLAAQHSGGAVGSLAQYPLSSRVANAVVSYVVYLSKTFWPSSLAVFYPLPRAGWAAWQVGGSVALLLAVSVAAVRLRRTAPYVLVGWWWYLITLLPVVGLVQVGEQARADRYTYIPMIGVAVIAVWGLADGARALGSGWHRARTARFAATSLGVAALLAFAAAARAQVAYWRDPVALFTRAVAVTEDNAMAHHNLGVALQRLGRIDEAARHYQAALNADPRYVEAMNNLAGVLTLRQRFEESEALLRRAILLRPGFAKAHYMLAVNFFYRSRYDESWAEVDRARALGFTPPKAFVAQLEANSGRSSR